MLDRIDGIDADIAAVDEQIEAHLAPFAAAAARLDEIPGVGSVAAAVIIAEVGADMSRFPTAGHLCSWAKFSPAISSSAGKTTGNGSTGHDNRYLARILGDAAAGAARTDSFLDERYRRIARRRAKNRAVVAVGRSILVIIWHLLADEDTRFTEVWSPKIHGFAGLVPYGVVGLVSALAMGARALAPPIAAAASHGAMCLIVVFMMFSCLLVRPIWTVSNHGALANRRRHR
jgi:hypothetical protein